MATGEPRGLTGIDDAIVEAACLAARRSGLSLSDWLHESIGRRAAVEGTAPNHHGRGDADEDALAAAIERLTQRIRGMDESARTVLTDLRGRLDEIAARLGAAAGARRRGADGSLTEIASIVEDLSRDIDDADETARSTVEGIRGACRQTTQKHQVNRVADAIRRLEERLSATPEAQPSQSEAAETTSLDTIRARLETLLAATPAAVPDADLDTTLRSLQGHIEEANRRLFGTSGDFSSAVAEISARRRTIDEEADLSALSEAQRQILQSLDILHDGIAALADRLAVLLDPVQEKSDKTLRTDRLGAIEGNIAAIRRGLETAECPRAIARLETRVAELTKAVESGLAAADTASGSAIAEALGNLEARLDTRLDLEAQIATLASKFDAAGADDRIGPAVKELEQQIARLASGLERSLPQTASLEDIESRLLRLQDVLTANQRETVEAARNAAQEAAERARGGDIVHALKQDLKEIRRLSWAADSRSQETLASVQATLARVVERLARLEGSRTNGSALDALKANGTHGIGTAMPRADPRPSPGRSSQPEIVKPDLAALRELVRSAAHGERYETVDRKADFIAAARRAAKAAAENPAPPSGKDLGDGNPGTFARIGQAIRSRRRTLLVTAAAAGLAAAAAHMFGGTGVEALDEDSKAAFSTADPADDSDKRLVVAAEAGAAQPPSDVHKAAGPVAETLPSEDPGAFVFAAPEQLDSRFNDTPPAPPTQAFVRHRDRAASLPLDATIGSAELREAAAAGNTNAAVEVAARYAEGRLVPRDLAAAALWYELAAEQGVAVAQNRLASLYERGQGVARDPAVAAAWYRRAANHGNTDAMHNLAVMLSGGIEGVADYSEAAEWFRAAADRGVEDSQYNLGVIYARGLGLDRDLVESYKWFALAANGDAEAAAHRDEVGGALSPDDLAKARSLVKAWRPTPAHAQANTVASLPDLWVDPTDGITEAERRSLVMKIQALLAEQGYDPGPPDGLEGPKTRQAIRAFQRKIGLAETGSIGSDVVAALADSSG